MTVTDELVDKLAGLAKLSFEGDKKSKIKKDFQNMLDFVAKLDELDTSGVEPLIHLSAESSRLRDDVNQQNISHEEALKNAPSKDSDYFKVPKVLTK